MKKDSSSSQPVTYSIIKSPVDDLLLVADETALIGLYFSGFAPEPGWIHDPSHPTLQQTRRELGEYFQGKLKRFSVTTRPEGTEFQKKIWTQITRIPYGNTVSYSDLAIGAGSPQAIRAAGTSTGRNPISIIIPCHRVIGKNGAMCGFGGGLPRKQFLLNLENPEARLL